MLNNNKKILLIAIPVVALLLCCCMILLIIPMGNDPKEVYLEEYNLAHQFADNGDYDTAILHYQKAIEKDKNQENPYLQMAFIYYDKFNDLSSAISILSQGLECTNSESIRNELDKLETLEMKNDIVKDDIEVAGKINSNIVNTINTYTYESYTTQSTIKKEYILSNLYSIEYVQYNALFTYENSNELTVLDSTGKPYSNAMPTKIEYYDLSELISGIDVGVTQEDLEKHGANSVTLNPYDNYLKIYTISFVFNTCKFTIGCTENGVINDKNAYNIIVPAQGNNKNRTTEVKGHIVSVLTGQYVNSAELIFRKGRNSRSGDEAEKVTVTDGSYTVNLEPGEYTAEVKASGYLREYFVFETSSNGATLEKNFSITPDLGSGKIRIVLEWGSNPSDLDAHLEGKTSDGTSIHCYYGNRKVQDAVKLDVDDRDGYGPETITLYDNGGTYRYYVHRFAGSGTIFSSGATVKIYTSSSQPIVITPPSGASEDWKVFDIKDGNIVNINGTVTSN